MLSNYVTTKALTTLATIVAGDYSRRIRRLSPKTTTVAEFGDKLCSRQCGQGFSRHVMTIEQSLYSH